jgi:AraC family transcriptional regulator
MSLSEDFVSSQVRNSGLRRTGDDLIREVGRKGATTNVVVAQTSTQRVDISRSLTIGSGADNFAITHMLRKAPGHGMTEPQARVDAYVACVHLDKRHVWRADIHCPFNVVNFYIPQSALDQIADEEGDQVEELHCPIIRAQVDTVFKNLVQALLPAMARPDQANRIFADHAVRAITAHLIRSYGSSRSQPYRDRGGLASWQERRAKELLRADLSGDMSLQELASACRLSSSHFSQAFKQTVGCPPHQWLLHQRVEQAKNLILNTKLPLSEIALATGFADQSHFTRVFSQRVKESPAAWRRAQGR